MLFCLRYSNKIFVSNVEILPDIFLINGSKNLTPGADVNANQDNGDTALIIAASQDANLVTTLLEAGM